MRPRTLLLSLGTPHSRNVDPGFVFSLQTYQTLVLLKPHPQIMGCTMQLCFVVDVSKPLKLCSPATSVSSSRVAGYHLALSPGMWLLPVSKQEKATVLATEKHSHWCVVHFVLNANALHFSTQDTA